jgi:hypothetical protein
MRISRMKAQQGRMDHGQLSKPKKPPRDALEHLTRKKERHAGEALKMWVKLI